MARTTKLELEQQLISSQRDNHLLRETNSVLRASNEALRAKLAEVEEERAVLGVQVAQLEHEAQEADATKEALVAAIVEPDSAPKKTWTPRPIKAWVRPAYMEAAREAAMRMGRVVRVGA